MTHEELLAFRKRQRPIKNVVSISADLLSEVSVVDKEKINVFLCLAGDLEAVRKTQRVDIENVLIISFASDDKVIDARLANDAPCHLIDAQLYGILGAAGLARRERRSPYREKISLPMPHGIVLPNMVLLQSLGFILEEAPRQIIETDAQAIDIVARTTKLSIEKIGPDNPAFSELIVYAPSVKVFFYDFKNSLWNKVLRGLDEKWKKQVIESCFRNKSYSSSPLSIAGRPSNPYDDPVLGPVLMERQSELFGTSMAIAVLANVQNLPSLRLPNAINLHAAKLRHIENLAKRSDKKAQRLLQKAFFDYIQELKKGIPPELSAFVAGTTRSCKICSDVPIEWIYFDKLPLMVTHEVSKLPMTPGNLLLRFATLGEPLTVRLHDVKKVLIVRSFSETDKIKYFLEEAIVDAALDGKIEIKIIDVQSEEEAIAALNQFDGAIVVFDCHGGHGGVESYGWLQFGKDRVNTWELALRARIPPIVMLSACSTAPIGGSHISVANGLLRSGARSVIGTFLPVDGRKSARFVAVVLYRVANYLPLINSWGYEFITWRTFITEVFQLSYFSDVLARFQDDLGLLEKEASDEIYLEGIENIFRRRTNWYEVAIEKISFITKLSKEDVLEKITVDNPLLETMHYCQIGVPELVGIWLGED